MVEIRRATEADIPGIVAMADALVREDAGQRDPHANVDWAEVEGAARYGQVVNDPQAVCFLAIVAGEPVGYVSGGIEPANTFCLVTGARLGSLFVRPGARGEGVGERLVETYLAWARTHGAARVTVSAFASNAGALRFYERAGFAPQTVTLQIGV